MMTLPFSPSTIAALARHAAIAARMTSTPAAIAIARAAALQVRLVTVPAAQVMAARNLQR
ncbi:MAG: hypothetical protein IT541_16095 [Hyphomicrobiales bacterium]|nr:hypothetical protein [Hyphomicrobiales bacterium]